jgi:hypothetical protein
MIMCDAAVSVHIQPSLCLSQNSVVEQRVVGAYKWDDGRRKLLMVCVNCVRRISRGCDYEDYFFWVDDESSAFH